MEWKLPQLKCLCFRTGLVIVLSVVLVIFAIFPLHRKISEENNETQKIVVGMEYAREKISRLGEYREQYEKIRSHKSEIDLVLSESELASFITELEATAQEAGGDIVVMQGPDIVALREQKMEKEDLDRPRLVDEMSGKTALSLSVRFSGSYSETVTFLHQLETLPYFLDVLALDLTARDGESTKVIVSSDVLLLGDARTTDTSPAVPSGRFVDAVFDIVLYSE